MAWFEKNRKSKEIERKKNEKTEKKRKEKETKSKRRKKNKKDKKKINPPPLPPLPLNSHPLSTLNCPLSLPLFLQIYILYNMKIIIFPLKNGSYTSGSETTVSPKEKIEKAPRST